MKKSGEIFIPDDVFDGEENHPVCCFYELFPASADPEENYFDKMFCHMLNDSSCAEICKGDYLKCPLEGKVSMIDKRGEVGGG